MRVGRAAASIARLSPRQSPESGLAAVGGLSRSGTAARHMEPLKNETTAARADDARRWWVLATVVAAQFIYGCDAFIVNVAIPTIARELTASEAQIEAVVAVYFIGYATLVITGGRLGDIFGTRNVFIAGVLGFAL